MGLISTETGIVVAFSTLTTGSIFCGVLSIKQNVLSSGAYTALLLSVIVNSSAIKGSIACLHFKLNGALPDATTG